MNAGEEAFLLRESRMTLRNKVLDIIKPITLDIQQQDIDAATTNEDKTYNCPAIRAAKRLFPQHEVFVGRHIVTITQKGARPWASQRSEPNNYEDFLGDTALGIFTRTWDTTRVAQPLRINLKRVQLYKNGMLNVPTSTWG